jgi:hypothetical protein
VPVIDLGARYRTGRIDTGRIDDFFVKISTFGLEYLNEFKRGIEFSFFSRQV